MKDSKSTTKTGYWGGNPLSKILSKTYEDKMAPQAQAPQI